MDVFVYGLLIIFSLFEKNVFIFIVIVESFYIIHFLDRFLVFMHNSCEFMTWSSAQYSCID